MGGKSNNSNEAVVKEQKAQADEARQKEADRQARIAQGLANIKAAFEGGNVTKTTSGSTTVPAYGSGTALPSGYTWVNTGGSGSTSGGTAAANAAPGITGAAITGGAPASKAAANSGAVSPRGSSGLSGGATTRVPGGGSSGGEYVPVSAGTGSGAGVGGTGATASKPAHWVVRGPDGTLHEVGSTVDYTSTSTTGSSGGFDNAFYDKYRTAMLNNLTPQVQKQYQEAKDNLTYALARAGTGKSSVATDETAKLAEQNTLANADVQSKADTAAADLRSRVASERSKAESQLYATENPDVASNQALAAVNNISLAKPESTTLGDLFKAAAIGGANAITGYNNQKLYNSIPAAYRRGTTSVVS